MASAERQGIRGHFCCVHDEAGGSRQLEGFLVDGLRQGLRVMYAGVGGVAALRPELAGMADLDALMSQGAVQVVSFTDVYGMSRPVDPERTVAFYAAATEQALADGYRGLRVAADVTDLVRSPRQRDEFARYEFLIGRYMAEHPLTAMCGYRRELGADTVTQFAALHTAAPSGSAPFQVFACTDGALGLAGDFDGGSWWNFKKVLARIQPAPDTAPLVVDMAGVRFADHRVLLTLDSYARARKLMVLLRSAPPIVGRLIALMPPGNLQLTGTAVAS